MSTARDRLWRFGAPLLVLVLALYSAALRYEAAVSHPAFDRERPESVLRSDPALLYHLTSQAVAAGGVPPIWQAEPNLAWPGHVRVLEDYTIGQELLVAWTKPLLGKDVPLHVYCLALFAVVAALTTVGVYGIGAEIGGASPRVGLLAALVFTLLPAGYRTIGFVLVREDLSLPLFAAHLWLGLRAARTGRGLDWFGSGVCLAGSLATWHAAGFLLTLEAGCVWLYTLARGSRPFGGKAAVMALPVVLAAVLVPALRAKGAFFSPGVALGLAVVIAGRLPERALRTGCLLGVPALALALGAWLTSSGRDMGHVLELLLAKVEHAGVPPDDPGQVSFQTRMMWQGPFATLGLGGLMTYLQVGFFALPLVAASFLVNRRSTGGQRLCLALLAIGLVLAALMERVMVLPALLLPPLFAHAIARLVDDRQRSLGVLGIASVLFFQGLWFFDWLDQQPAAWYSEARARETVRLVEAIRHEVPLGEPIAADFMLGPVLLAAGGHPIVVQPKWETRAARLRVENLWRALYFEDLPRLQDLLGEWRVSWFAVDRAMLGANAASLYLGGVPPGGALPPGKAVTLLTADDPRALEQEPGVELRWTSPSVNAAPGVYRLLRFAQ